MKIQFGQKNLTSKLIFHISENVHGRHPTGFSRLHHTLQYHFVQKVKNVITFTLAFKDLSRPWSYLHFKMMVIHIFALMTFVCRFHYKAFPSGTKHTSHPSTPVWKLSSLNGYIQHWWQTMSDIAVEPAGQLWPAPAGLAYDWGSTAVPSCEKGPSNPPEKMTSLWKALTFSDLLQTALARKKSENPTSKQTVLWWWTIKLSVTLYNV